MMKLMLLAMLGVAAAATVWSGRSYTVETTGGVPRIHIDGKAVPARIFFGCEPEVCEATVGTDWTEAECFFRVFSDCAGKGSYRVTFPDAREGDTVELGEIEFYSTRRHRTVSGAQLPDALRKVSFAGKDAAAIAAFKIEHPGGLLLEQGDPFELKFRARASRPMRIKIEPGFYRADGQWAQLSGKSGVQSAQVRLAHDAGTDFVSFTVWSLWPGEEKLSRRRAVFIKAACDRVLAANPHALLIPRVMVDAPRAFLDAHPDEVMVRRGADGKRRTGAMHSGYASPCSAVYRAEAAEAVRLTVEFLERAYGDAFAGIHVAGQNTAEWFTAGTWIDDYPGYSPAARAAWRRFVAARYADDAALRAAWREDAVTRETAEVPEPGALAAAAKRRRLDPQVPGDGRILDFNDFLQEEMTDCVLGLVKAARAATRGRKLVMVFYGYTFAFGGCTGGAAMSAHLGLGKLLKSPDFDILCSPMAYFDRQPGGGAHAMPPADSVMRAGKLYFYEDDTSTHIAAAEGNRCPGWESGAKTPAESRDLLLRNTAQATLRNFGTWWMDLSRRGWFDSAELWAVQKELAEMTAWFMANPTPYAPEIALVIDERAMRGTSGGSMEYVSEMLSRCARVGAPYGQYLASEPLPGSVKLAVVVPWNGALADAPDGVAALRATAATTTADIRAAAERAGVHFYTDAASACNVCANGPYILLHASKTGPVTLTPRRAPPVTLNLRQGETRVVRE